MSELTEITRMNRPSSPWLTESATHRYDRTDGHRDLDEFDAYGDYADYGDRGDRHDHDGSADDVEDYDDYDEYGDYEGYAHDPDDRRWLWVATVAGIVLLIAVAGTMMILSGGDSGTTSATVAPSLSSPAPYPTGAPSPSAVPTPSATRPPAALSPETVTSVTPPPAAATTPPPTDAAPPPAADPRTVTYQVTGNRQLLDLVTVIYTDHQGALQTEVNVALPWTKQVVLDPGVDLSSVTATSIAGQLNCTITDASGATLASQNNNTMIANCTR